MEPVTCAGCGKHIDPLRAGHVAIFSERFRYFCGWDCREQFVQQSTFAAALGTTAQPEPPVQASAPADIAPLAPLEGDEGEAPADFVMPPDEAMDTVAALPPARSDLGTILLLSATVAAVLAIALALVGTSSTVLTIRLALAVLGTALLVARSFVSPREPSDPPPAAVHGAAIGASIVAVGARLVGSPVADEAAVLTGLIVVSTGTSIQLVEQVRRPALARLAALRDGLAVAARRVVAGGYAVVPSTALHPGEEVVIHAGEMVPADVVISAGGATVLPWLDARSATSKRPGDALVAGARLISGRLRATVTWTGFDCAWLRTTADATRAAHVLAPVARTARLVVERWALAAAALAALAAFVNGAPAVDVLLAALAGHAAISSLATAAIPSLHVLHGTLGSLTRGIVYQSATAWERVAHTTAVVFSARGTLLLGEPQVAEIVGLGTCSPERLLSLASGAEMASTDPIAVAVQREARARSVVPDAVRSPLLVPGLGVTAVTSEGEPLCVGSRALMLREHISMALLEGKLAELEALGRTVLMVAVGSRLVGFIGLQDGLRRGARAAVQYLLDAGVEPVLMSGDARETCEALARSLDIEHVRPEVLPSERVTEIRRISEAGATVAVVGRPSQDDAALGAADVAVALEAAGTTLGEWAVRLAGDDVRDAARAVVSARRARGHARTALVISLAPGIAAALVIAFGLLPPSYAPLAVLLGSVAAHLHVRAVHSPDEEPLSRPLA